MHVFTLLLIRCVAAAPLLMPRMSICAADALQPRSGVVLEPCFATSNMAVGFCAQDASLTHNRRAVVQLAALILAQMAVLC